MVLSAMSAEQENSFEDEFEDSEEDEIEDDDF